MMLDVKAIVFQQSQSIKDWHLNIFELADGLPLQLIEENNQWNYKLWHEEDAARIENIDPSMIMMAKRNIDRYNQCRNNSIEQIDEWILHYLSTKKISMGSRLHSETPGMMIDRLSIMALRRYHMLEESERQDATALHREMCKERSLIIEEQIEDLSVCLAEVVRQLEDGELRFKVYRQLKMYNDPNLNPQLYKRTKG